MFLYVFYKLAVRGNIVSLYTGVLCTFCAIQNFYHYSNMENNTAIQQIHDFF
jgi:hypothetical protein